MPQIAGFKQAGMKKRRKMKAEMQVYFAKVMVGIGPADSTTLAWILEKISLNSGGQLGAEERIRFRSSRICFNNRGQFSSTSSPGFKCAGST